MIYINFYHGRPNIDSEMDNWGTPGPVVGPVQFSCTYGIFTVHKDWNEDDVDLIQKDGLFKVGEMWYGDFEIQSELRPQDKNRLISFNDFKKLFPQGKPVTTEISPDWEEEEDFEQQANFYCKKVYGDTLKGLMIDPEDIERAKRDGENPQGFVDALAEEFDWVTVKEHTSGDKIF